jgi:hypothetical protein
LVIITWRRPVVWLSRRAVVWLRRWPVVWVRRGRRVIPVLDSDKRPVVETGSGTGFIGEPSRRQWSHKRREHRL